MLRNAIQITQHLWKKKKKIKVIATCNNPMKYSFSVLKCKYQHSTRSFKSLGASLVSSVGLSTCVFFFFFF